MTTKNPPKALCKKLHQVMHAVRHLQKTGVNSQHYYRYATQADITTALSNAMMEEGIFMFSSLLERDCQPCTLHYGKAGFLVSVKLAVTFVDIDSGEHYTSTFYGDGADTAARGIYKAISGAQKYALIKTFLVPTSDYADLDPANYGTSKATMAKKPKDSSPDQSIAEIHQAHVELIAENAHQTGERSC